MITRYEIESICIGVDCHDTGIHASPYEKGDWVQWAEVSVSIEDVIQAAERVINRWHSPDWNETPHTGEYIKMLEQAVNEFKDGRQNEKCND